MNSKLYQGFVEHERFHPARHRLVYNLYINALYLDELAHLDRTLPLFGYNRPRPVSLHDSDYLDSTSESIREKLLRRLASHMATDDIHRIIMVTSPRLMGYIFNPVCLYYCLGKDGRLLAAVAEVNNTFGEKHYYLLHGKETDLKWPVHQSHAKNFHVSPFINMDADYEFRIGKPDATATVGIRESQHGELMLVAAVKGKQVAFNTANLLRQSLRVPFQTLKVLAAIHWHALWIWLAGTPFYTKPPAPKNEVS